MKAGLGKQLVSYEEYARIWRQVQQIHTKIAYDLVRVEARKSGLTAKETWKLVKGIKWETGYKIAEIARKILRRRRREKWQRMMKYEIIKNAQH